MTALDALTIGAGHNGLVAARPPRGLGAEGDSVQGELTFDLLRLDRPVPGHAAYRSPVKDLWICGSCPHPGWDVMGAREAMRRPRSCARPSRTAAQGLHRRRLLCPQEHIRLHPQPGASGPRGGLAPGQPPPDDHRHRPHHRRPGAKGLSQHLPHRGAAFFAEDVPMGRLIRCPCHGFTHAAEDGRLVSTAHARPTFPGLTAAEARTGRAFLTFRPTGNIVAHADHVGWVRIGPTGPQTMRLVAEWHFAPATRAQPGFDAAHIASFATLVMTRDGTAAKME